MLSHFNTGFLSPERVWRKAILPTLLVGMEVGAATVEDSMDVPQKLKTEVSYDLSIPLLAHIQTKV